MIEQHTPDESTTSQPTVWAGGPITLASGRVINLRPLNLLTEVLAGTLPDQILDWCVFRTGSRRERYAERVAELYQAKLMVCARGLVSPRLRLGPPDDITNVSPNESKGEVGPATFKLAEIDEIYSILMEEVVPAAATAPFRSDDVPSGASEPAT